MRFWFMVAGVFLTACNVPKWFGQPPRLQREAAYEWLVVAPGRGQADRREAACDQAHDNAFAQVRSLFIATYKHQSDMVAAAGGPARVERVLLAFANEIGRVSAQTTALFYDDARRRCYVELSWFLPRHLAQAVRRNVESLTTEEGVALEFSRALLHDPLAIDADRNPVSAKKASPSKASVLEAVQAVYPGWFVRFVQPNPCPERQLAFVGAPGGAESRWLWLLADESGFRIEKDQRLQGDDWPTPPEQQCP